METQLKNEIYCLAKGLDMHTERLLGMFEEPFSGDAAQTTLI